MGPAHRHRHHSNQTHHHILVKIVASNRIMRELKLIVMIVARDFLVLLIETSVTDRRNVVKRNELEECFRWMHCEISGFCGRMISVGVFVAG